MLLVVEKPRRYVMLPSFRGSMECFESSSPSLAPRTKVCELLQISLWAFKSSQMMCGEGVLEIKFSSLEASTGLPGSRYTPMSVYSCLPIVVMAHAYSLSLWGGMSISEAGISLRMPMSNLLIWPSRFE